MKYQKEIVKGQYDVIIIGSGIAGLVSAANLVSEGLSVLVLEQHSIPGGATTMFSRKGFTFEAGGHRVSGIRNPGGALYDLLEKIGKEVELHPINPVYVVKSGEKILIADSDLEKYKQNVIDMFPHEKGNIDRYFAAMLEIVEGIKYVTGNNFVNPLVILARHRLFAKYAKKSTREFMNEFFIDEEIIAFLTMLSAYTTLPLEEQSFVSYVNMWAVHHLGEGMSLIKGGTKTLVDALVDYVDTHGGQVVLSKLVDKILTENKRVIGIKTSSGEEIKAEVVVSTASNEQTYFQLLDESLSSKKFLQTILNQEQSGSLFQLFLGIKEENGEGLENVTTFVMNERNEAPHSKIYDWDLETITSNGVITVEGKENSPDGYRSVNISCLIPYHHPENWFIKGRDKSEYCRFKDTIAEMIIENMSQYIPNLQERIIIQNTATPLTIERYTFATEGGLQGLAHNHKQSGKARGSIKTHIENLYQAGQYTFPGAGIVTVSISGTICAEMIVNEHFSHLIPRG
ncbi:MAG: NAD(P)/FAD-dependent oxidoreductase [Anaerolineales bacterium]|nr:NAD(P)/FAD-dependent oxidoreductase [Anaerolineales bacterium]